ncbi:uncharacterized protein LOC130710569 [Lotus japonicus]|uniref:uncharacterized protein LOC130710569 n=1 Tax=Lotus japonicus TaxID=34305 RepID=UPI0025830179|nr:uncharacterized protein LOC130710569 [Lotus japonicus]
MGILPVRAELRKRGIEMDTSCPFCMEEEETWFATSLSMRFSHGDAPALYIQQILDSDDSEVIGMSFTFIYAIWEQRNSVIHKGLPASFKVVLQRLAALRCPDNSDLVASPTARVENVSTSWRRPRGGTIKLNFDASWTADTGAGFGMITQNFNGEVMAVAAFGRVEAPSALVAEVLAFRWCMLLARDLGFFRVVLETDCKHLFETWKKNKPRSSYLFSILNNCREKRSLYFLVLIYPLCAVLAIVWLIIWQKTPQNFPMLFGLRRFRQNWTLW